MRIVVVGVMAESMVTFRGDMLRSMVEHGNDVLAVAPEENAEVRQALAAIGVECLIMHWMRQPPVDESEL